jgi:hypothetical protein
MKKKKQMNDPHHIFIDLYKPGRFQKFFKGFLEFLQKNLQKREVIGHNQRYSIYTCGQPHDPRNPDWAPFKLLQEYCKKTGDHFGSAKSMIEDHIGEILICECQLLNDQRAIRRKELEKFGVDFGAPGRKELDII